VWGGGRFEAIATYASYKRNPASDFEREMAAGATYVAVSLDGRPIVAGRYLVAQGGYALFVGISPVVYGTAERITRELLLFASPGTVRRVQATIKNPSGIPPAVERYYREAMAQREQPESQAWATAWSRYCKYKRPGSDHCRMRREDYFPGRQGKGANPGRARPIAVELERLDGPPHLAPQAKAIDSYAGDPMKLAQKVLKEWAVSIPAGEINRIRYVIRYEDGLQLAGDLPLSRKWVKEHTLESAVRLMAIFNAGLRAPDGISNTAYRKALKGVDVEFWKRLLRTHDFGRSEPEPK